MTKYFLNVTVSRGSSQHYAVCKNPIRLSDEQYLTALIKRQWGQNLIKFRGVKLPGGLELNGREIYDDAERELERIREKMMLEYELPPLDFIG